MKYAVGFWEHFLPGSRNKETTLRLVLDMEDDRIVAAEASQALVEGEPSKWRALTGAESSDVLDSLLNANSEVFMSPEDYGLEETVSLPRWAWRAMQRDRDRSNESDLSLN